MSGFQFAKKPISIYKDIHSFNDEFKTEIMDKDYSHHFKQDFYTVYNEAYVVMKPHLRKWESGYLSLDLCYKPLI